MSMPLLSTKLSVKPPRTDFVPRPHLVETPNQGAKEKLTLICAKRPAGFGKSTLVSIWAQQAINPVTGLELANLFLIPLDDKRQWYRYHHYRAHFRDPSFVRSLLQSSPNPPSNAPITQPLIDPLSERELEVLQLIAQGFSNQQIAEHGHACPTPPFPQPQHRQMGYPVRYWACRYKAIGGSWWGTF